MNRGSPAFHAGVTVQVDPVGTRPPRATDPAARTPARPVCDEGWKMATDYDAPRRGESDELGEDSLEELKARRAEAQSGTIDVDETELNEALELPGADLSSLSGEELTVRVLPKQEDEFTCSRCFLVHHRSRLGREKNGQPICRDCA